MRSPTAPSTASRASVLAARSLLRALDGWRLAEAHDGRGPVAVLLDRLHSVGHLPALPGIGVLAARLVGLETEHAVETSGPVLRDMALSLELLRQVNTAQVRGTQVAGNGPVLAMRPPGAGRRQGVRQAVAALRAWPGAAQRSGSCRAQAADGPRPASPRMPRRRCGHRLRRRAVYLVAVLQNLGRLLVQYPLRARGPQIAELMAPIAAEDAEDGREAPA